MSEDAPTRRVGEPLGRVAAPPVGPAPARWIVVREGRQGRWGGELRRRYVFDRLAVRTAATVVERGWYPRLIREAARGRLGRLPGPLVYGLPRRGAKPRLAASERLREATLDAARRSADPAVVAIYDDPVAQARALGVPLESTWAATTAARQQANLAAFRWYVVPTASFADLAGLPADRIIVGGNGTDTQRIQPGPWPLEPTLGFVSAAAPGRGLETLVEAARLARGQVPGLRLRMWLVTLGSTTDAYLAAFRAGVSDDPWVEIGSAAYDDLGPALASASVLAIPHPPNEYMDVALPVKLFDSAAAGRPLLVTPRLETARLVGEHGIGVVAGGDAPADLAAALVTLLRDEQRLHALGARAREVAEQVFDWRVVGDRIADAVLEREGR